MLRDIPWWVKQGDMSLLLYENKCSSCGTKLFVNRRKTRLKYTGPDSLDFSSSRITAEEKMRTGTLYTPVYDIAGYSNGKIHMLKIGLFTQRFSICKKCGSEGERLVKLHIIKQWIKEENASIEDCVKDVKEHTVSIEKRVRKYKANLKKMIVELEALRGILEK